MEQKGMKSIKDRNLAKVIEQTWFNKGKIQKLEKVGSLVTTGRTKIDSIQSNFGELKLDDELQLELKPNSSYSINFILLSSGPVGAGMSFQIVFPEGATGWTTQVSPGVAFLDPLEEPRAIPTTEDNIRLATFNARIKTIAGGTCGLSWGKQIDIAGDVVLYADSSFVAIELIG